MISREQLEESRRRGGCVYGYKTAFYELHDCCEVCDKKVRFVCKIICCLEELQIKRILKICQPAEGSDLFAEAVTAEESKCVPDQYMWLMSRFEKER